MSSDVYIFKNKSYELTNDSKQAVTFPGFTQFGVSFSLTSLLFTTNRMVKTNQVRAAQPKLASICFHDDRTCFVLDTISLAKEKKEGICWNRFCFVVAQLCLGDPGKLSSHSILEILKYLLQIHKSKFVCCIKGNLPDRTICLGSHRQIYKNSFGVKIIQWTSGFHALSQQNQVWATFQEIWYKGLLRLNVLIEEKFSFRRRERLTVSRNDNLQEDVLKSWQNICSIQTTRRGKHVCTS